ncbi:radical SAM protein [bacterium]|nr:radical SAM protein [bacterium]
MNWCIYYRGSLSSCNYTCAYCPFAKTRNTRAQLARDRSQLRRFCAWTRAQSNRIRVLFTPWGEALGHGYYRRALVELSQQANIDRVAIQTNLSAPLDDLQEASSRLSLWATYHPGQTSQARFLGQCARLEEMNLSYCVGVVGLKEHFPEISRLRQELPAQRYLWVNAYKRETGYYSAQDIHFLKSIDAYFAYNLHRYPSFNSACRAGESSFAVDGDGNLRRCHFVGQVLANIYEPDFESQLGPRSCPNASCGCYIGYVQRPQLRLEKIFGDGLLERVPTSFSWSG